MKRSCVLSFLLFASLMTGRTVIAGQSEAQRLAAITPPGYPVWLARLLAPFGIAGAQALAGSDALQYDACKGANLLLRAAQQHQLFAEFQLSGLYQDLGEQTQDIEALKQALLWHLHWQTHFPKDDDWSHIRAENAKLTPEQENAVREKFKTWTPADERPSEPASCPRPKPPRE